jgi:hypothetical protein
MFITCGTHGSRVCKPPSLQATFCYLSTFHTLPLSLSFFPRELKKMASPNDTTSSTTDLVVKQTETLTLETLGNRQILARSLGTLAQYAQSDRVAAAELNHLCTIAMSAATRITYLVDQLETNEANVGKLTESVNNTTKTVDSLGKTIDTQAALSRTALELAQTIENKASTESDTAILNLHDAEEKLRGVEEERDMWKRLFSLLPKFLAKYGSDWQDCKNKTCIACCRKSDKQGHKQLNRTHAWNSTLADNGVPPALFYKFPLPQ